MRTESEFISAIDCQFPFGDQAVASELIREACQISPNAAYMVAHELARPPASDETPSMIRLRLLDQLEDAFEHPLKGLVLGVTRRMIQGELIGADECLGAMRTVGTYKNMYNALAIVCSAGYSGDDAMQIDRIYDELVAKWRAD